MAMTVLAFLVSLVALRTASVAATVAEATVASQQFCNETAAVGFYTSCRSCVLTHLGCPEGSEDATSHSTPLELRHPAISHPNCHYHVLLSDQDMLQLAGCKLRCYRNTTTSVCCDGNWGFNCGPCPGGAANPCFGHGTCADGVDGNGTCTCDERFGGFACEHCAKSSQYGKNCTSECLCKNGYCNAGVAGDGSCTCNSGYEGRYCNESISACGDLQCHGNARCAAAGDTAACVCSYGYEGDGIDCRPVNRCQEVPAICHQAATCSMTGPALFECRCKPGYLGDGFMCVPVDPCQNHDYGGCPMESMICRFTGPGQSRCECLAGYEGFVDGVGCQLVDVCQQNTSLCHPNANCSTVAPGEYQCVCHDGYVGDGNTCYGNIIQRLKELHASDPELRGKFVYAIRLMEYTYNDTLAAHGPFTVLAATDIGFSYSSWLYRMFRNEISAQILMRQHLIASQLSLNELANASLFYTLDGSSVQLTYGQGDLAYNIKAGSDQIAVLRGDIVASNGLIHVIGGLINKPIIGSHKMRLISIIRSHHIKFFKLLVAADLKYLLESEDEMTVFAPTNSAFDALPAGTMIYLESDEGKQKLSLILKNHFVQRPLIHVTDLVNLQRFVSISDTASKVHLTRRGQIRLNDRINVSRTEYLVTTGVVHVIEGVLVPAIAEPILPHRCDLTSYRSVWGTCAVCHGTLRCPLYTDVPLERMKRGCSYWVSIPDRATGFRYQSFIGCHRLCNRTYSIQRCCDGFYGEDCFPCPGGHQNPCFGRGKCNEGSAGDGVCTCNPLYNGTNCEVCVDESKFGPLCDKNCTCLYGSCRHGVSAEARAGQCQTASCRSGLVGPDCSLRAERCMGRMHCHVNASCVARNLRLRSPRLDRLESMIRLHRTRRSFLFWHRINYRRCVCNEGYSGNGESCVEVDSCQTDRGGCHVQAKCVKTGPGINSCTCDDGWFGDGKRCSPIIVCRTHDQCHERAQCVNTSPGKFQCICSRGFHGNGTHCINVDICLENHGGCHANATCTSTGPGTAVCNCTANMGGDGFSCYGSIAYETLHVYHLTRFQQLFKRIPTADNYLVDLSDRYTLLAPSDVAINAFLRTAAADFWKEEANLIVLFGYHTLKEALALDELRQLAGSNVSAMVMDDQFRISISLKDSKILVNDAEIIRGDIPAINGYIHIIDKVLEPYPVSGVREGLGELLARHPELSTITDLLQRFGMLKTIAMYHAYTLFLPTNEFMDTIHQNMSAKILSYYVVSRRLLRAQLHPGMTAPTLLGETHQAQLTFSIQHQQTFVNDVPIIQADLVTFGGMVHVIGGVLMPVLNRCDQYSFTIEKGTCTPCDVHLPCASPLSLRLLLNPHECPESYIYGHDVECTQICDERHVQKSCCKGFKGADCIDLCDVNNGGCHPLADCSAEEDIAVCSCPPGLKGDGYDVCYSECDLLKGGGGCHPDAICSIKPRSGSAPASATNRDEVVCRCRVGYHGDGHQCHPNVVSCRRENGGCPARADCSQIPAVESPIGYEILCSCKAPYVGNGTECHGDIMDTLGRLPPAAKFLYMLQSIQSSNSTDGELVKLLANPKGNMTLFVPVDSNLKDQVKSVSAADLKAYIVQGRVYLSPSLQPNHSIVVTSLANQQLVIECSDTAAGKEHTCLVNGIRIVRANILTLNGLIHLIAAPMSPLSGQNASLLSQHYDTLPWIIGGAVGLIVFVALIVLAVRFRNQLCLVPAKVRNRIYLRHGGSYAAFDGDEVKFVEDT